MNPTTLIVICSTVRTGSTLLCELLRQAGLGAAREVFNGTLPYLPQVSGYVARIRETQSGGIWATKVMYAQLLELLGALPAAWGSWAPDRILDAVIAGTGAARVVYFYTRRRDKLRQAASLIRVQTTGVWHTAAHDPESPPIPLPYDPDQIRQYMAMFDRMETCWAAYFQARQIAPTTIWFEDLVADLPGTTRQLAAVVGLSLSLQFMPVSPFRKTAGDGVEALVARYRQEYGQ